MGCSICHKHVKAGDVMVQQGTNHAWVILIDAKEPPAWTQGWTKM